MIESLQYYISNSWKFIGTVGDWYYFTNLSSIGFNALAKTS